MAKKSNTPSLHKTHPILGYRVLPSIKKKLTDRLEKVLKSYNKDLGGLEKPYKKNDIFVEALERGLSEMENES